MRHTTDNSLAVAFKVDIPATSDLWNYPKVVADAWISWGTEVPDAQFRTMTISRDNMLGAYALVHNFNDASWIPLPLVNGWVAYDTGAYSLPRYRRTGQTVEVQGLIKNGTVHAACAALPSGYQPDGGMLIFLSSSDTGNARVDVWEDGSLIARDGGNAWRSLNNIKFPVGGVQ